MIVVVLKVIMIRDNGLCMRAACGSYVIWGRDEKGGPEVPYSYVLDRPYPRPQRLDYHRLDTCHRPSDMVSSTHDYSDKITQIDLAPKYMYSCKRCKLANFTLIFVTTWSTN